MVDAPRQNGREGSEASEAARTEAPAERRRLRVAWVAGHQTLERIGRTLQPLAIGLMDELVDLTLACPQEVDIGPLPSPPMAVSRYGRLKWLAFGTRAVEALATELRSRKIELLHALDADAAGLTGRLARRAAAKYVVGSYALGDARRLGWLDDRAAAVLAASEPVRAELVQRRVARPARVFLVRPGVYHVRHATCFNEPDCSVSIVAGGPLEDFPAFDAVLQAFAELHARNYDCAFFIIGRGRAEKRMRARVENLRLRSKLTFVDIRSAEQLLRIYEAADIYVSPIPSRPVDMDLLAAMAAGVPVLAARDGASDFLIDGRTAQLFARGEAAELTMKLVALLDDRAAARSLAESALGHIRAAHSPADMVSAVAGIYRGALQ